jgi:hypothetical protein
MTRRTPPTEPPQAPEPADETPPGSFVSEEHEEDCARFLAEVRSLVHRRTQDG